MDKVEIQFSWRESKQDWICTASAVSSESKTIGELQGSLSKKYPTDFVIKFGDAGIQEAKKAVEEMLKNLLRRLYGLD